MKVFPSAFLAGQPDLVGYPMALSLHLLYGLSPKFVYVNPKLTLYSKIKGLGQWGTVQFTSHTVSRKYQIHIDYRV
jgi:hypothetical protein